MAKHEQTQQADLPAHGANVLPSVIVDSYNVEIEDEDGFIGDKASKGAFWEFVEKWRKPLKEIGEDPFGDKPGEKLGKKKLAELLASGDPEAASLVQSAIEDFAQQLALVIRRFMRLKAWRDTETIFVGGGFRASRVGELAVARTELLLRAEEIDMDLELIHNDPDEAGLLGAAHLLPAWMLKGHDGILAIDIGGTNFRAGVIELNLKKSSELAKAKIVKSDLWRHGDDDPDRETATKRLIEMLEDLIEWGRKNEMELAPVVGIGCPGVINNDGSIERGSQNLPGNWESSRFNLPQLIRERITRIGDGETMVVMHNDAVVQGLSELPYIEDRKHWGILTIGTGLGNARFTHRSTPKAASKS
ncbi:ROK family protein [Hyphomicrobium sp.]|jgi:predicted NBD/HSP70 family sugar kinase|uniref:ROK family protein n=1 Tax=Hyphomicrobium sp. TaxID=82 RepID=UPI002D04BD84|nr:ROK family protein [Hyphomicrobium sp.]HVZ05002.1 ROK family protein [Hyphomicrobium sp.]